MGAAVVSACKTRLSLLLLVAAIWLCLCPCLSEAKKKKGTSCSADFFTKYHLSSEISSFVDSCVDTYGAKSAAIGKSAEGKSLKVITIGSGPKEIFVMGGLHGREWIAPAGTLWAMHEVMHRGMIPTDPMATFLQNNKIHFLALVNPDGYDYTFTKSETQDRRQWRKNRRLLPCKGERCAHGVDLNRNWGIEGRTFGFGATRPTSDVFQGKRPFSEPEIKAIKDWLLDRGRGKHIDYVLDIHCCAQTVLPPSYYHDESEALKNEHLQIARKVAQAMTLVNQEQYGSRARETEFSASNSGISVDWIYGESGVGLALIVETRGNEKNRKLENIFDVDAKHIPAIGAEILAAISTVADTPLSNRAQRTDPPQVVKTEVPQVNAEIYNQEPIRNPVEVDRAHEDRGSGTLDTTAFENKKTSLSKDAVYSSLNSDTDTEDEEENIAPLVIDEEVDEPPPPIPDDLPPPAPEEAEDDFPKHSEAYLRRHRSDSALNMKVPFGDESPLHTSEEEPEAPPLIDEDVHTETFLGREVEPTALEPQESELTQSKMEAELLAEEKEMDEEIDVILGEVSQRSVSTEKVGISQDANVPEATSLMRVDHSPEGIQQPSDGLIIVDEDEEDDEESVLREELEEEADSEESAEDLTRRLRNRINQLRAIRQAQTPSKWTILKNKIRKGKWRLPVALALVILLLWQLATRKNRVRRDD